MAAHLGHRPTRRAAEPAGAAGWGSAVTQQQRRRNPYPWTFEIPALVATALALAAVVGVQAGRVVANLIAGAGLHLPPRHALFATVWPVLAGDAAAGLHLTTGGVVAGPALLRVCVAVAVVLLLTGGGLAAWVIVGRWGPSRIRGVASRREAERLLGRQRLWRHRAIIRPDLYPTTHRQQHAVAGRVRARGLR